MVIANILIQYFFSSPKSTTPAQPVFKKDAGHRAYEPTPDEVMQADSLNVQDLASDGEPQLKREGGVDHLSPKITSI
jgi:hypothetical protein